VAVRRAAGLLTRDQSAELPETVWYSAKRRLLGPPMINAQLQEERLSNTIALGVLSPDGISSSAYGTEEILIELLPIFGAAAFAVLVPMTGVILFVMLLVVLSYREVVTVYTRAGGSYVVARENFGPRIAQVAAVALLIDYVVTVAVQVAAGTAAVASTFPAIGPYSKEITIGVILLMCFGNLRGIREAGKIFALPTYLFSGAIILMIVVGLVRAAVGDLPQQDVHQIHGLYTVGPGASAFTTFALIFALARSFANGGSSLTGIEAVSNAVSAFRPPEGLNARKVLVTEGVILGTLVAGISGLAYLTHAAPFKVGYPTVISQEADIVFGSAGHFMFFVVQAATALILYTGGNTSFNGFPFLTSFVAEDSFLPRWMMKRGQRLVFSNGIIVLTVLSVTLIAVVGANVNALVPFYAIGVFTAFSMAGFGMARYHTRHKEPGWRHKRVINFSAGVMTAIVVLIFAVVKFTEGAWLILIIFPLLVILLIRLNQEYRHEARALGNIGERRASGEAPRRPNYIRRVVIVFVDDFDLSTVAALRYARSLRPTTVRAVRDGKVPAPLTPVPGPPQDGGQPHGGQQHGEWPLKAAVAAAPAEETGAEPEPLPGAGGYDRPVPPPDVTPIGSIRQPGKAAVEGRVRVVEIRSVERNSVLACEICDSTGDLTALFYGRSHISGIECGSRVRFRGPVGLKGGARVMVNPAYELIVPPVTSGSE
jgi:amino acid transporter